MSFVESLEQALRFTPTEAKDVATVHLARTYAQTLDEDGDLAKYGPLLLSVLVQLGMAPKARAAVTGGGDRDGDQPNPLDQLRARRAARQHTAQAVDPAAT